MHEYRRFIQSELDARGWRQADLVRKSGLSRQLVSQLVRDDRPYLGQMPDEETMVGLANGFGVPVERVRTAAARSLVGYEDDGAALTITLSDVSTDALLNEIRRRIDDRTATQSSSDSADPSPAPRAQGRADQKMTPVHAGDVDGGTDPEGKAADEARPNVWRDKPTSLSDRRSSRQPEPEELPEEDPADAIAARTRDPRFPPDIPEDDGIGEENQDQE